MPADTDGTTTTSSRESKVLRITFDIILISSGSCYPKSLINLFSYVLVSNRDLTLQTRTINMPIF